MSWIPYVGPPSDEYPNSCCLDPNIDTDDFQSFCLSCGRVVAHNLILASSSSLNNDFDPSQQTIYDRSYRIQSNGPSIFRQGPYVESNEPTRPSEYHERHMVSKSHVTVS